MLISAEERRGLSAIVLSSSILHLMTSSSLSAGTLVNNAVSSLDLSSSSGFNSKSFTSSTNCFEFLT